MYKGSQLFQSDNLLYALYSFIFELIKCEPGCQIPVRVISQFGEESSKVME